ncbi:PAS domain-containing protein [Ovoidimarina sediminis]|uniref:PAS domain-containing protein n=1 Tax=Ovoidimarina sediminis TaxID=3079856 RepID=UPI0029146F13|nr:PAS domain-containing protein [Rhodophyticola sp. MJ-SS7]MDU8944819.1 hypothetical protein [Rhodophyticola sp. MJ-SS7]
MPSDPSRTRETNTADLVAESLMPGRPDAVRRLFNAQGAPAPTILWSPELSELPSPQMRRFAALLDTWRDADGRVPRDDFDLEAFEGLKDWIMLVEPEGESFRYSYYGKGIQNHYGRDLTGLLTREIGGHIAQFFEGVYRAAHQRGEWVYSEHEPPQAVFVRAWRRLIVPLYTGDEVISAFAVVNLPENELRAGLELMPDPVFVIAEDHSVQYVNRAGLRFFDLSPTRQPAENLQDLTGIALENAGSAENMLAAGRVVDSIQLTLKGGIAERLVMTVSAAEHRGRAYYVAVMRLIPT